MSREPALTVAEVFYSIQGESTYAGLPCLFFRLSGCNLRCAYCDAAYTYQEPGKPVPVEELLRQAARYPQTLVAVTGGEPLLQENLVPLLAGLLDQGHRVLLETNGSLRIDRVPAAVIKIVDMKCPDSGMSTRMDLDNLALLAPHDQLKFVLSSRRDYEWALSLIRGHRLAGRLEILFSPVNPLLPPPLLASWLLADQLPIRLQLQLHALLWPEQRRGV